MTSLNAYESNTYRVYQNTWREIQADPFANHLKTEKSMQQNATSIFQPHRIRLKRHVTSKSSWI